MDFIIACCGAQLSMDHKNKKRQQERLGLEK